MIEKLLIYIGSIYFKFNLLQLIMISVITIITIILTAIVLMTIKTVRRQKMIDESIRAKRARIAQVVSEIRKPEQETSEDDKPVTIEKIQSQVLSEETAKPPKTRAMSMEERWADYEKKRAAKWHTA